VAALTTSILFHAALGIVLAGVVWATGAGWLLLLRRPPTLDRELVFAYPLGLLATLVACGLFLTWRPLGIPGVALVVVPLVLAARSRAVFAAAARRTAAAVTRGLPAIVGLATTLGFFLHGPTASVDSNAFGDVVWYAAKLESARQSLFPLRDLSAAGVDLWRAEIGPSLLGATVSYVPKIDPLLVHTSLLPAFLGASLCCGLALSPVASGAPRLRVAVLAVGMTAYASWFAESPPVTLALPLAFAVAELVERPLPKRWFGIVVTAIAVDLALTKGLALVPFGILVAFALRRYSLTRRERRVLAISVPILVAALLAATLANSWWVLRAASLHFSPLDALRGLRSQLDTRSTIRAAPGLQLAGYLLLGGFLWRTRRIALLVALAVSLVWSWTILEYSIEIGLGTIVLLTALLVLRDPPRDRIDLALLGTAAGCLALGAWFRDFAGVRAAFVESACLAAIVLSAVAPRRLAFLVRLYAFAGAGVLLALSGHALPAGLLLLAGAAVASATTPRLVIAAAAALLAVGVAAAVRAGRADDLRLGTYDTTILTHEHYQVWHEVAKVVPRGGLVFTDETGDEVQATTGQNYYPATAGRQVYLAGWYQSRLREDTSDRERRLRLNELVLEGKVPPHQVDSTGRYDAYYAVVTKGDHPPSFRRLYANDRFALYRIG
jgi:hypothetical protein